MPRYPIDRATNFIVEKESWTVVEYDHTSVPGVIYLSLTEGKINLIYDDIENNIADLDKLAKYELLMPPITQIFHLGDHIEPVFTIMKNGKMLAASEQEQRDMINLISTNKRIVNNIDGELIAVGNGTVTIIAQLKENSEIQNSIEITVDDSQINIPFSAYLEGQDTIRLDRKASYKLKGTDNIQDEVTFNLEATNLASILSSENNLCVIHANANNKLGTINLMATYHGQTYTKEIKIIPLW